MLLPTKNKTTKYEHVIPQLVAIEQDPKIQGLSSYLNTVGGDIEAGLAIARDGQQLVQTDGVPRARRRPLHRRSHCRGGTLPLHRAHRDHYRSIRSGLRVCSSACRRRTSTWTKCRTGSSGFSWIIPHYRTSGCVKPCSARASSSGRGHRVMGRDAVDLGLIDELGGYEQAMDMLQPSHCGEQRDFLQRRGTRWSGPWHVVACSAEDRRLAALRTPSEATTGGLTMLWTIVPEEWIMDVEEAPPVVSRNVCRSGAGRAGALDRRNDRVCTAFCPLIPRTTCGPNCSRERFGCAPTTNPHRFSYGVA